MKPESDDLSSALEQLRNRPIVTESRDYARRWERSRSMCPARAPPATGRASTV